MIGDDQKQPRKFRNRAVLFPGDVHWICQGVERDICAQGASLMEAVESFERTVASEIALGNYEKIQAPPRYIQEARGFDITIRPYAGFTLQDGYVGLETSYRVIDRPQVFV